LKRVEGFRFKLPFSNELIRNLVARYCLGPVVGECAVMKLEHHALKAGGILGTSVCPRSWAAASSYTCFRLRTFIIEGLEHF
jgi:hypothetical protein